MSKFNLIFRSKTKTFNVQDDVIKKIKNLDYAGIFFEQGLGKTKIAIETLLSWFSEQKIERVIIVTKKVFLKLGWKSLKNIALSYLFN